MVVVDAFTKYVEFFAVPNITAECTAKILVDEWICRYSVPENILSDLGTNYQSSLIEQVYEYLDIKQKRTTPLHPRCDGQSEIVVKKVKQMSKFYVDKDQTNWDLHLKKLSFAYNTSVQSTTKQTPFEMRYGFKPRIPSDVVIKCVNLEKRIQAFLIVMVKK